MEQIGFIEKNNLNLLNGLNSFDILSNLKIKFGDRDLLEQSNNTIQFICAGVVLTKNNQVMIINKHRSSTGNNSPEMGKTLLYVGGHLDILDFSKDNYETFVNGMKREIFEELNLEINDANIKQPFLTYTPTTEKSAKHLGIIFPVIIDKPFETNFTDGKCKFVSINSLHKIKNFESWSQIISSELFEKSNTNQNTLDY